MVRCKRYGTVNPAIDLWCSSCHAFLDWNAEPTNPLPKPPRPSPGGGGRYPARGRERAPRPDMTPDRRPRRWLLPVVALAAVGAAVFVALPVAGGLRLAALQTAAKAGLPFAAGQGSRATSEAAPATPTPQLTPLTTPDSTPTPDLNPTPEVTPTPDATPTPEDSVPSIQPLPEAGVERDPARAVARFYDLVQNHQFDSAAQLWSARMQAKYPPAEFIDQRFASTRQIDLRAARVVAEGGGVATVAIDLVEASGDARRHWAGTWQLVLSPSGWLLNQPNLWAMSLGGND